MLWLKGVFSWLLNLLDHGLQRTGGDILIKAVVRFGDGIGRRSWLRSVVKNVQQGLLNVGLPMGVDGRFGAGTRTTAKAFQQANGLEPTGVFDKATWKTVSEHLPQPAADVNLLLKNFNGDLDWVHQQEGFRGRPYWPGGASGVTLDPGIDVGHASMDFIEALYGPLLTKRQMGALRLVLGFKGADARDALKKSRLIQTIRITSAEGVALMPHTAQPYWDGITRRFPALARKDTPASVQTVLLSLAYNRGILNRHLESLGAPLKAKKWDEVAAIIGSMQQNHKLKGIRVRRRQEGMVIEAELRFMAS
jgi:hypothetical protein